MTLWLTIAAMTALALALVLRPLLRRAPPAEGRRAHELRVYRAQLAELEREREQGLLPEREAEAARLEIQRRILAADAAGGEAGASPPSRAGRAAALLAALVLPALSGLVYWQLGSPGQPSAPYAGRAEERRAVAEQGAGAPAIDELIARLAQRTEDRPDDAIAWLRLGQAYAISRNFPRAAEALERAVALDPESPDARSALGETLVMASGGVVTERAGEQFRAALARDPDDPRARYYSGLSLLQKGDRQRALDAWVELLGSTPADAPWAGSLRTQVAALAEELGLDPDAALPDALAGAERDEAPGAPGPDAEDLRAAGEMASEKRQEMVRNMVEGLAARLEREPDDAPGWRRLGRSYEVLGQPEKSAEAYGRAAELLPGDLGAQVDYAGALAALDEPEAAPSPRLVEQIRRVIRLDDANPLALFVLGKAAAAKGAFEEAEGYWQRLLTQLPPDSPHRAGIEGLIEQLNAGG
jgi:cytochrome c-type biogenesis protein CcmH